MTTGKQKIDGQFRFTYLSENGVEVLKIEKKQRVCRWAFFHRFFRDEWVVIFHGEVEAIHRGVEFLFDVKMGDE